METAQGLAGASMGLADGLAQGDATTQMTSLDHFATIIWEILTEPELGFESYRQLIRAMDRETQKISEEWPLDLQFSDLPTMLTLLLMLVKYF